jgi:hypothetical protein
MFQSLGVREQRNDTLAIQVIPRLGRYPAIDCCIRTSIVDVSLDPFPLPLWILPNGINDLVFDCWLSKQMRSLFPLPKCLCADIQTLKLGKGSIELFRVKLLVN